MTARTTLWSGIGMNYGHNVDSTHYNPSQVNSDFTFLWNVGIRRLRIVFPDYNSTTYLANCQDMVTRALFKGFYVVFGVSTSGTITSTVWSAFKTMVTGTLAPWAQSVGLSELCLANEIELNVDGTTLTATTARSDIRSMASTVKSGGYVGKVSYSTSILLTYRSPWESEGIGSLDYIAWNSYDVLSNFTIRVDDVATVFGATTYVSEFGSINVGFGDYTSELSYWTDVSNRIAAIIAAPISYGYFFTYRDGAGGVGANTFGLVQTNGIPHVAAISVLGMAGYSRNTPVVLINGVPV